LSALGAHVIDADKVAREVTDRRETLEELAAAFGGWIIDESGRFNRAAASARAFSDGAFLARLTAITHKYIIEEIDGRIAAIRSAGTPGSGSAETSARRVIVIDAPIPVERGFLDISDVVWVVRAPRERRLERVISRDNIDAGAAAARFASQIADAGYDRLADVIIDNGAGLDALEAEIRRRYQLLFAEGSEGSGRR